MRESIPGVCRLVPYQRRACSAALDFAAHRFTCPSGRFGGRTARRAYPVRARRGKPVGIRHGRATVTGERTRHEPLGPSGTREGSGERGSGSQETCPSARGPSPSREGRRAMIHRRIGGIAAVLLLLLGSCGESTTPQASPETPSTEAAFPVTIAAANGDVTLEDRPERIVSLSPTATEMLFAIGAGDQVEAVDDQSNYPPDAPVTDLSGFEPNVEAIASFEPDLVVYATEPGDLGASLEGLGIPALQQDAAASLDDVYAQIGELGKATGKASEAAELVDGMRGDIDTIVDSIEPTEPPLSFYHELDDTYYSVTSSTFIGQLYARTGLVNIADEAKGA